TSKRSALLGAAVVLRLVTAASPSYAISIDLSSGPFIQHELFRTDSGGPACTAFTNPTSCDWIWENSLVSFAFDIPVSAAGDGIFRMFAGGDLNNVTDRIGVILDHFTDAGALAFPVPTDPTHFLDCGGPHGTNPPGCPVPESVPGGRFYDPSRGPAVGN